VFRCLFFKPTLALFVGIVTHPYNKHTKAALPCIPTHIRSTRDSRAVPSLVIKKSISNLFVRRNHVITASAPNSGIFTPICRLHSEAFLTFTLTPSLLGFHHLTFPRSPLLLHAWPHSSPAAAIGLRAPCSTSLSLCLHHHHHHPSHVSPKRLPVKGSILSFSPVDSEYRISLS